MFKMLSDNFVTHNVHKEWSSAVGAVRGAEQTRVLVAWELRT